MKLAVVGLGYTGLSLAVLLSQHNEVAAVDIDIERIDKINKKISPIKDKYIEEYLQKKSLRLFATTDQELAYKNAEFIIIATPTNYDSDKNYFDTRSVDEVIQSVIKINPQAIIVIKSTVPVGYTESIKLKYNVKNIIFSPEFLRESKALYDNLYPSRIVIGYDLDNITIKPHANKFADLLLEGAVKKDIPILFIKSTEAEAVKLFANTYLAMRVAYFNELDTYARSKNLSTKSLIEGICLDPRIGDQYNNPSFGYGGYCLPKDTKQLLAEFKGIPENLISATVEANITRKKFISRDIIKHVNLINKESVTIGIYRLIMKVNSDNFRCSAIQDVIHDLQAAGFNIKMYEPTLLEDYFENISVVHSLADFKNICDIIITNRLEDPLLDVANKIYTCDIYKRD